MSGFTIGDFYIDIQTDSVPFYYYHRAIFWPEWIQNELPAFQTQVSQMSSKSKPLKLTATSRIQMGYPHEVSDKHKQELYAKGTQRDTTSSQLTILIPKLTLSRLQSIWSEDNIIATSTPTTSQYLRDITVVDKISHDKLVFCYVVSRRGHILTAWSELKHRDGTWQPRAPKNFNKLLSLQTKPLNN